MENDRKSSGKSEERARHEESRTGAGNQLLLLLTDVHVQCFRFSCLGIDEVKFAVTCCSFEPHIFSLVRLIFQAPGIKVIRVNLH